MKHRFLKGDFHVEKKQHLKNLLYLLFDVLTKVFFYCQMRLNEKSSLGIQHLLNVGR